MKITLRAFIVVVVAILSMNGCTLPSGSQMSATNGNRCAERPTGDLGGFRVEVQSVKWPRSVTHPAFAQFSSQQRKAAGMNTQRSPAASFLTIDLKVTNTTNTPKAWIFAGRYMKNFKVVTSAGTEYESRSDLSSMLMATGGGWGNMNPGIPATGTIVFDVPKQDYTFVILQQKNTGFGMWLEEPLFRCTIQV